MKITIKPTSKIVVLKPGTLADGVPARTWEGETESGIKVHCFVTRIAIDKNEPRTSEFETELQKTAAPSAGIAAYPASLIL